MKYKDLVRKLKSMGCVLRRQGAKHEFWLNPATGECQSVPRHKEINEYTARAILEDLETPPDATDTTDDSSS